MVKMSLRKLASRQLHRLFRRRTRTRNDEAYLFSTEANARRLMDAYEAARRGEGLLVEDLDGFIAEHRVESR